MSRYMTMMRLAVRLQIMMIARSPVNHLGRTLNGKINRMESDNLELRRNRKIN